MPELVNAGDPYPDEDFPTGPAVGELLPDFTLPDQNGSLVTYSETRGTNKAFVLFYRSASW